MQTIRVFRVGAWTGVIAQFCGLDAEKQLRESVYYSDSRFVVLR